MKIARDERVSLKLKVGVNIFNSCLVGRSVWVHVFGNEKKNDLHSANSKKLQK